MNILEKTSEIGKGSELQVRLPLATTKYLGSQGLLRKAAATNPPWTTARAPNDAAGGSRTHCLKKQLLNARFVAVLRRAHNPRGPCKMIIFLMRSR